MTFIDADYKELALASNRKSEPTITKKVRFNFWRKAKWFMSGVAVAGGIAVFAYRTGADTMAILGKARDALVWTISGAEEARKREEYLLSALDGYRMRLEWQQGVLERLDKLSICRSVIEAVPKTVPSRAVRTQKKAKWPTPEELARIFGSDG
jgi:hypothetical protein